MREHHWYAIALLLMFGAWQEYVMDGNNLLVSAAAWSVGVAISAFIFPEDDR